MKPADEGHLGTIQKYFEDLNKVYTREPGAVERLLDLWTDDGVFEFCGAPPVTGVFHGKNAVHVLYTSRFRLQGMTVTLPGGDGTLPRKTAVQFVHRTVNRVKVVADDIVSAWTTATISTADGSGFECSGNYTCRFRDGKIAKVRIVVSPKGEAAQGLRFQDLAVEDIGRLALAAWAVV
jgi:ketosteroid isomerase-like protein